MAHPNFYKITSKVIRNNKFFAAYCLMVPDLGDHSWNRDYLSIANEDTGTAQVWFEDRAFLAEAVRKLNEGNHDNL